MEQMRAVKAQWDEAPASARKDVALAHFKAAEDPLKAKNEASCIMNLDAAAAALK